MKDNNINQQTVIALDIGTTKICAVAGHYNIHGQLKILSYHKVASEGVRRGVVSNIHKTVDAIKEVVGRVEKESGLKAKNLVVGIAGQHIRSKMHNGQLMRDSARDEISKTDIDKLVNDVYKLALPAGQKIIHVIPQEFRVDNERILEEPIGMSGAQLEANFHIITGEVPAIQNIYRCVEQAGYKVGSLILEPIASGLAVLNEDETESGVALVDIGGGTTDLAIFHEGVIRHTAVIPFGGEIITEDIKEGCKVMSDGAEKLKIKFGYAMPEAIEQELTIRVPGPRGHEPREVSQVNLSKIIEARVQEIFENIHFQIQKSGYSDKLICGIVVTGGGAQLSHIDSMIEKFLGIPCKLGLPQERLEQGYSEQICSPIFSTAIGLLCYGLEEVENKQELNVYYKTEPKQTELFSNESQNDEIAEKEEAKQLLTLNIRDLFENVIDKTKSFFSDEGDKKL